MTAYQETATCISEKNKDKYLVCILFAVGRLVCNKDYYAKDGYEKNIRSHLFCLKC